MDKEALFMVLKGTVVLLFIIAIVYFIEILKILRGVKNET